MRGVPPRTGEVALVDDVPAAFADIVVSEASAARRGCAGGAPFVLVLSGGPTAQRCYEHLASRADEVRWEDVVVLVGDERCVPADDADANQRLIREALLDRVPPVRAFVPFGPFDPAPYQRLLAGGLRPDVVHLGLGPDGHTASLFPDSAGLWAPPAQLVTANTDPSGRSPHRRLTWTLHALHRARLAVFTVSGASKAPAWAAVRSGCRLPATLVRAERVRWLVDPEAATDPAAPLRAGVHAPLPR